MRVKITKNQLKELVRQSIYDTISEQETIKFKDPETGKEHEVTMDTAKRYKADIEAGDPFPEMDVAFNLNGLHKTNPGLVKSQTDAREILTKELFLKYQDLSFWQNV